MPGFSPSEPDTVYSFSFHLTPPSLRSRHSCCLWVRVLLLCDAQPWTLQGGQLGWCSPAVMDGSEHWVVHSGDSRCNGQSITRLQLTHARLVGVRSADEASRSLDTTVEEGDAGQGGQVQIFVVDVFGLDVFGVFRIGAGGGRGECEQCYPGGRLLQTDRGAHCGTPDGKWGGRMQGRRETSDTHEGRLKLHEGLVMTPKIGFSRA